jgi:transposase
MKSLREFSNIFLCVKPVDFRKGIFSLASYVQSEFNADLCSGMLFLFTNKNRKNLRALYWDKTGFALWSKALEKDKFPWPKKETKNRQINITTDEFSWLLNGINPWKIKSHAELFYSKIN